MSYSYHSHRDHDLHGHARAAHGGEGRHRPQAHAAPLRQPVAMPASPSYEAEVIELLKAGYLGTVTYGFRRDGNWIEPTLRYTARDLAGAVGQRRRSGPRSAPGADISGAVFYSYLTYSAAWDQLTRGASRTPSRATLALLARWRARAGRQRLFRRRPDLLIRRTRARPRQRQELLMSTQARPSTICSNGASPIPISSRKTGSPGLSASTTRRAG